MRRHDLKPVLFAFFLTGCASAGSGGEGDPRVPVYRADEETPCEYEFIGTVVAEVPAQVGSGPDFEAEREKKLGEAGAKKGADAVILSEIRLPFAIGSVTTAGQFRAAPSQEPRRVEGKAVLWIEGTCRG